LIFMTDFLWLICFGIEFSEIETVTPDVGAFSSIPQKRLKKK